jgi:hypothetical protein
VLVTHQMALAKVVYEDQVHFVRGNHEVGSGNTSWGGGAYKGSGQVHLGRGGPSGCCYVTCDCEPLHY